MYIQGVYSPALIGTLLIHTPTSKEVGPIYTTTQGNNAYRVCWGIYSTSFQRLSSLCCSLHFVETFFLFPSFAETTFGRRYIIHCTCFGSAAKLGGGRIDPSNGFCIPTIYVCSAQKWRREKKRRKKNWRKRSFFISFFYSNPFRFSGHVDLCWTSVSGPAVWLVTQHTHTILCVCYCIAVLVFLPLKLPDR